LPLGASFQEMADSSPMAEIIVTKVSLPSSNAAWIWVPRSPSGSLIVLSCTIIGHEVEETFIDVDKLVFSTVDVWNVHIVSGGREIFQFFAGEDINGNQVNLSMPVLASF